MGKKTERLCNWKKADINKNLIKFSKIVANPEFVCEKCGRVADKKKWLHDPITLKK